MNGWIKVHRKIIEWEWYSDTNTFRVFFHLLLLANHEKKRWRRIEIDRGQILIGRNKLAKTLGISPKNVRTSLRHLKSTNEVAIKTTNKFSLITINNYKLYQQDGQQDGQQGASKGPARGHNQEYKNIRTKEDKKGTGASIDASPPFPKKEVKSLFLPDEPMKENQLKEEGFPRKRRFGHEGYNYLLDFFEFRFGRSLEGTDAKNKQFLMHLKRVYGLGRVRDLIEWLSDPDCWWTDKVRNFAFIWYKRAVLFEQMESYSKRPSASLNLDDIK